MKLTADRYAGASSSLTLDTDALSRYTDLVDLSIGDTDFVTDSRIIDAAARDARAGYTHYGFPQGDPQLIDAIRASWKEDYNVDISRDEIFISASSCLGMSQLMTAVLNPGDEVIVLAPYFALYRQQIEMAGGVCVEVASYEEEAYALNAERLEAAVTPRTRAIILNNPCNPTGAAYTRKDLELLAETAKKHDLMLIGDEIYTRYVFEGEFIPLLTLPGIRDRLVTLNSFSKNFMMTGWRVGCIICPPELRQVIQWVNGAQIYTAPSVSQRAAIEALAIRRDIEKLYVSKYRDRMVYASDRIEKIPYMTIARPRGTFYLFPSIKKTGLSSKAFCAEALRQAHVLMSPGCAFGACGEGYVRIAATQPMEKLKAAFDRLEKMKF